jgi:hypothetical protein
MLVTGRSTASGWAWTRLESSINPKPGRGLKNAHAAKPQSHSSGVRFVEITCFDCKTIIIY